MLRDLVGEANFKKGIRAYYSKFYNANATTDDFRSEMEKSSGKDLKMFFNQWLYQPINPVINGNWNFDAKNKKLTIELKQTQKGDIVFNLPIEIAYYKKGNAIPAILKLNLSEKQKTQTFSIAAEPEKVVIDPRNILLSENDFLKKIK